MLDFILKHLPEVAVAISIGSLAVVGAVLTLFVRPKITDIESTKNELGNLNARVEALKIDKYIGDLQALAVAFAKLDGAELVSRTKTLETRVFTNILPDLAELKTSELNRNETLKKAIDVQSKFIKRLEADIRKAIDRGDKRTLLELYETRAQQLETAYVIARMRGGTEEEQALARWKRAQDELAKLKRDSDEA